MARRAIKWAPIAWEDLEKIAEFIARDSERYAAAVVREIRDASRSLDVLSERGRVVPEFANPNVRELIVGSYRLIYEVAADSVTVVGVIHGARDLSRSWERQRRAPE